MINIEKLAGVTCSDCTKKKYCDDPCVWVDKLAGGKKITREYLPPPAPRQSTLDCNNCGQSVCNTNCPDINYNASLAATQKKRENFRKKTIVDIRQLDAIRVRAISALLYADFSVADIPHVVELLNIKQRRIYQIIGSFSEPGR